LPVPADFEPLSSSPFGERIGPLYPSTAGAEPVVGLLIEDDHTNRAGRVHGGLLMTVADIAISRAVRDHLPPRASFATADLYIAFLEGVGAGRWLEATPSIDRVGRSLIHGSCILSVDSEPIARILATVAVRMPAAD
jgi:acyl-coenzyme A thioesterase PaaI-like protein